MAGLTWPVGRAPRTQPAAARETRPAHNPLNNAYFGDLQVHKKISVESFLRKNMLSSPIWYGP